MILNWPVAVIMMIILLLIGVLATIYPIISMRLFILWLNKFLQIPEEELKPQKRELMYLLTNAPEEYAKRFGDHLLIMRGMGCLALLGALILLAGIILDVIDMIRN